MDFSGAQAGELAIPMHAANVVASPYGGGSPALQLAHHEHGGSNNGQPPAVAPPRSPASAATAEDTEMEMETETPTPTAGKKPAAGIAAVAAKYRECLKNHAAAIGGNATDGCGEFMPSGEEGSLEALKCSACGCHRNFHRKEAEDEEEDVYAVPDGFLGHRAARRLLAPAMAHAHAHPHHNSAGGGLLVSDPYGVGVGAYAAARALPPALPAPPGHQHQVHHHHQYVMPLSMMQTSESDEMLAEGAGAARGGGSSSSSRKRFRTKFTPEQKARMLAFAERVGWRLQKLDDAMVQAFCQEIGVKRRVLKVWMHNNKHNLATKRLDAAAEEASPPPPQQQQQAAMAAAMASSPPPLQMQVPAGVMPPPPPPQHQQQQAGGPSCLLAGHVSPPPLKLE